jgi:hypothetical protein
MKHMKCLFYSAVLLVLSIASFAGNQEMSRIEVDIPPEAVAGFPIPVSFKVSGPIRMPIASLGIDVNPFSMTLKSDIGEVRFPEQRYQVYYRPNITLDGFSETLETSAELDVIKSGETRKYIMDLSRLMELQGRHRFCLSEMTDAELLPAGTYTLVVSHNGEEVVYLNRSIRILSPSKEERSFLEQVRSRHRNWHDDRRIQPFMNSVWETFVCDYDAAFADSKLDHLSLLAQQQLGYYLALGKAIRGRDISSELFLNIDGDAMSRFYEADLKFLQYEAAQAKGNSERALSLQVEILRLRPHWDKRVLNAEKQGRGIIDYFKDLRDQRKQGGKQHSRADKQQSGE